MNKILIIAIAYAIIGAMSIKNTNAQKTGTFYDKVNDYTYKTVTIGDQTWFAENLRAEKYNDGEKISLVEKEKWVLYRNFMWYNFDKDNKSKYGGLYGWESGDYMEKLCPSGWHIPTVAEWDTLITYLEGPQVVGSKVKEFNLNLTATASYEGEFRITENNSFFWTSTPVSAVKTTYGFYTVEHYTAYIPHFSTTNEYETFQKLSDIHFYQIRCIKD